MNAKKFGLFLLTLFFGLTLLNDPVHAQRSGGTFVFVAPYDGSILTLDPHKTSKEQDFLVAMNIHKSLYAWNSDENRPLPELADKVSISQDGLVYTYTLKKNILFHNQRKLVSDDIIYSYERILSLKPASPARRFINIIQGSKDFAQGKTTRLSGIKKIDDKTFSITFNKRIDPSYDLYQPGTAILPRDVIEAKGDEFGISPIGCGPFKFSTWTKGSEVVLERFDGFYKANRPFLDTLVFKIMMESASRDIAFRSKELDATLVGASQYPLYKRDSNISANLIEVGETNTRLVCLNPKYKPLADKRVRQAINHAINAKLINEKFLKGKAYDPVGWLPVSSPAFDSDAKGYEYDPEKALALMKEAGYERGFNLEFLGTGNKSYGIPVVEALVPFLQKINITITMQQLEGGILYDRLVADDYQAIIWSFNSGPDPYQALRRWHSANPNNSGNYVHYNNLEYDKLLNLSRQTTDINQQLTYLKQADRLFQADAPIWFSNYNKAVVAKQGWVHGIKPVAIEMMYQQFEDVWVDKSSPRASK